jgi:hypothetical protein
MHVRKYRWFRWFCWFRWAKAQPAQPAQPAIAEPTLVGWYKNWASTLGRRSSTIFIFCVRQFAGRARFLFSEHDRSLGEHDFYFLSTMVRWASTIFIF